MMTCSQRGWTEGDLFICKARGIPYFNYGELLVLHRDDGSYCPAFKSAQGPVDRPYWYLSLENDVAFVGRYATPAARKGLAVGMTAYVKETKAGDPSRRRLNIGDRVVLALDDGTHDPIFRKFEQGGGSAVINLDRLSIDPVESAEETTELFEEKPTEEEVGMSKYPDTPAGRMKLNVGDLVRVIRNEDDLKVGDILVLSHDDDSDCPFFKRHGASEGSMSYCPWLSNVEKFASESEKVGEHVNVAVGGEVKENDVLFLKDGRVTVADRYHDGPDCDDEYSTRCGYVSVGEVKYIIRFMEQVPKKTTVTIEITEDTAQRLRRSGDVLVSTDIRNVSPDFCDSVVEVIRAVSETEED